MDVGVNSLQDLMHRSGGDPSAPFVFLVEAVGSHRKRLAAARLSVREDANVVPIQEACNQVLHLVVYLSLGARLRENVVKNERMLLRGRSEF